LQPSFIDDILVHSRLFPGCISRRADDYGLHIHTDPLSNAPTTATRRAYAKRKKMIVQSIYYIDIVKFDTRTKHLRGTLCDIAKRHRYLGTRPLVNSQKFCPRLGTPTSTMACRTKGAALRRTGHTVAALFAPLLAFPAQLALGQELSLENRPFAFRVGAGYSWDSNVFRVPESAPDPQAAQGKAGKADRFATGYVGLRVDKSYGQQRFLLDGEKSATRYDKFSTLDFDGYRYRGEWQWHLGPRINGNLFADASQSAIGFEDIVQGSHRIVRNTKNYGASVDGWLYGGWHLLATRFESERKSTQQYLAQPDGRASTTELGIRYLAPSQNSITLTRRSRDGTSASGTVDTINFIDSEVSVTETELVAVWLIRAASSMRARLTTTDYRYPNLPQRDFSGTGGEVTYSMSPTGALVLNFAAIRTLVPWTADLATSYRVDNRLSFDPTWRIGARATIRMSAYRGLTDYLGPVAPTTGPLRSDVVRGVNVSADWSPHTKVLLSAILRLERRSSNYAQFEFSDTTAGANAVLTF